VNLRNDFVHANLTKSLIRHIVDEDGHTFVFGNDDDSIVSANFSLLGLPHVEHSRQIIDNVISLVIEAMTARTKREFNSIIYDPHIQIHLEDGLLIPVVR
jgi:hypothetical protein